MNERLILSRQEYDFEAGILNDFDFENDESLRSKYCGEMGQLSDAIRQRFPDAGKYLSYRLHDSRVLSHSYIKNNSLQFTFNDYYFIDFAFALKDIEKLSISRKKFVFPVKLEFRGLRKCPVYWCNRNNKFLPLKTEKYLPQLHEIQNAEIQEVGHDFIKVGMEFWSKQADSRGPTCSKPFLYMQIIFAHMSVEERQKESLYNLFETRYYPLLDAFSAEIDKGTYFDFTVAKEFIKAHQHLI